MSSFPMINSRVLVGQLILKIREQYGETMEVNIHDPRCYLWFFDLVRFNIRATEVVWILDGKLLARGIPLWEELRESLQEAVGF